MHTNYTTKFLDLPDIVATDLIQTEHFFLFIAEPKNQSVKCPDCNSITDKVHDQRWQNIKDIPIRNKPVLIRLHKKRYRCPECGKRAITQKYESIDSYARKTNRYDKYLADEASSKDYTKVSKENGLSYTSIKNAVEKVIDPVIEKKTSDLKSIKAISIDEFAILKKFKYGVVISDPINHRIIDILPSRKKKYLIKYFDSWPDDRLNKIKYVSMDMWRPFKSMVQSVFPNAEIVVDKFHLVAKVNETLDNIRKNEQNKVTKATRKRFYKSRMLLKKAGEDLTDKEHKKLIDIFEISPALEKAWELKEEFRDLLKIDDIKEAIKALNAWYKRISTYKFTQFYKVRKMIKRWEQKLLNYFKTKITNGFAEGINNKIKLIKRIGYGIPNVMNLRRRVFHSIL